MVHVRIGALCVALLSLWAAAVRAETFAVLVGINDYRYFGVRDLQYSESDVELMRDTLVAHCDVPPGNIRVLLGRDATRRAIGLSIRQWLAERSTSADRVLFYFAGHGTQLQDDNGDEADGLDESLWAWDTGILDLTWVRDDDLNRWLSAVSAREKVVILDCCHSGTGSRFQGDHSVRAATVAAADVRIASLETRLEAERAIAGSPAGGDATADATMFTAPRQESVAAEFAACLPHQLVVETAQYKHGALTYFLTEGLSGAADADLDGVITLGELQRYSARRIQEHGCAQEPQLYGVDASSFVLVAGPPPALRGATSAIEAAAKGANDGAAPPVWRARAPYVRVAVEGGFHAPDAGTESHIPGIVAAVSSVVGVEAPSDLPPDMILTGEADGDDGGQLVQASNALSGELYGEWAVATDEDAAACGLALQSIARGPAARKALLAIQNLRSPLRVRRERGPEGQEIVAGDGAALLALSVARDGALTVRGAPSGALSLESMDGPWRKVIIVASGAADAMPEVWDASPAEAWDAITSLGAALPPDAWGAVAIAAEPQGAQ